MKFSHLGWRRIFCSPFNKSQVLCVKGNSLLRRFSVDSIYPFIPLSTSVTMEKTFPLKNMVNFRTLLRDTSSLGSTMTSVISWHLCQVFKETIIQHDTRSHLLIGVFSRDFHGVSFDPRAKKKSSPMEKIIFHSWGVPEVTILIVIYFINHSGRQGRLGLLGFMACDSVEKN